MSNFKDNSGHLVLIVTFLLSSLFSIVCLNAFVKHVLSVVICDIIYLES